MTALGMVLDKLNSHETVYVYGRWHSAPQTWASDCVNIHADRDVPADYEPYCAEFRQLAIALRSLGHVADDLCGSHLTVCRRASPAALSLAEQLWLRHGVQRGDVVVVSHNLGTEAHVVTDIRPDGKFLDFEHDAQSGLHRCWVREILRTPVPLSVLRRPLSTWLQVHENGESRGWEETNPTRPFMVATLCRYAREDRVTTLTLADWDGWGDRGGPGKKLADLGTFRVHRRGRQVFVEQIN